MFLIFGRFVYFFRRKDSQRQQLVPMRLQVPAAGPRIALSGLNNKGGPMGEIKISRNTLHYLQENLREFGLNPSQWMIQCQSYSNSKVLIVEKTDPGMILIGKFNKQRTPKRWESLEFTSF